MRNLLLDRDTADRLLSGAVAPDDAPPGYAGVAGLLRSCAQLPPPDAVRERATIVAMTQRIRSHRPATTPSIHGRVGAGRSVRLKVVGVGVGAMLVGTSGLAFAGELPAPAQRIAHTVFGSIGVDIPTPEPASHDDVSGGPELPTPSVGFPTTKGDQISGLARDHTGRTGEHGAVVSGVASDGQSQAGQPHGQSDQPHGGSGQPHGQSGQPHGQSDQPHGHADEPHGQPDATHPAQGRSHR